MLPPPPPAKITGVSIEGKKVIIAGENFKKGSKIVLDGEDQKTQEDEENPSKKLIAPKAGKKIDRGKKVKVQVREPNGTLTDPVEFTRP